MSVENKVEFLWNCALALRGDQQIHKTLRSYYVNTCRILSMNNLLVPKEKFGPSQMCSYCGSFWYDSKFQMKLIPKKISNNNKARKLVEKLNKTTNTLQGASLNRKQKKRAKWLRKRISNYLKIKCDYCKHKSLLKMENPKNNAININEKLPKYEKEFVKTESGVSSEQKKKANKKNHKNGEENNVAKSCELNRRKKKSTSQKNMNRTEQKYESVNKTKRKNIPTNNTSTKVISKTKKQNSLLQLATLLQKNSQKKEIKSSISKLNSFLK